MFTGIVESRGKIIEARFSGNDCRLKIDAGGLDMGDVQLGDSIAIDGVCLTVVEFNDSSFAMDVSGETLRLTSLGGFKAGRHVNLEKALTPTTRLGGHLVSGHVDGLGTVESREIVGESIRFKIRVPDALARYIAVKGSVCIDGISLTVNEVEGAVFGINIIPHTAERTTIGEFESGRKVNIEVDLLARYLERLMLGDAAADPNGQGVTLEMLREHGFLKA